MENINNCICLIPARGGSKRIPKKNIKMFSGKPIIGWSIELAKRLGIFEGIYVSTDSRDIANVAESFGAKTIQRSAKSSDDKATITDVVSETIQYFKSSGMNFENVCLLYATAPNAREDEMLEGLSLLRTGDYDAVFSVLKYRFPIQRALSFQPNGTINYIDQSNVYTRSQDLSATYHDAGQWIWLNIEKFQKNGGKLIGNNTGAIELNPLRVHDIDDEIDWKIAEEKFNNVAGEN